MKYITEMIFFFFSDTTSHNFCVEIHTNQIQVQKLHFSELVPPAAWGKTNFISRASLQVRGTNICWQKKGKIGRKKKPQQKFHSLDRKIFSRCCGCRETGSSEKSHPPQSHTAAEITHRFHLLLLYCVTSLLQYFTSNSPSLVLLLFGLNLHTGLMSFKH